MRKGKFISSLLWVIVSLFFSIVFYNFFKHGLFIFHDYSPSFIKENYQAGNYQWSKLTNLGEFNPLAAAVVPLSQFLNLSLSWNNVFLSEILLYTSVFLFGFLAAYFLFRYLFSEKILSIFLSLFYLLNMFVVCRAYDGHIYLLTIYFSLPLFILLLDKYLNEPTYKGWELFLLALLSGIFLGGHGNIPMSAGTLILPIIIYFLVSITLSHHKISRIKKTALFVLVSILVNLYWLLPTIYYYRQDFINSSISTTKSFGFDWPDIAGQEGGILSLFQGTSHWLWGAYWAGDWWYDFSAVYKSTPILQVLLLFFPSLAFFGLLPKRKDEVTDRIFYFAVITLVIHLFLSNGIQLPTGEMWKLFYNKIPLFNIFRAPPTKFGGPLFLSECILAGIFIKSILRKRVLYISLTIALFVTTIIIGYPLISGNVFYRNQTGYWDHRNLPYIPEDYLNVSKLINNDAYDANVYEYTFGLFGFYDYGYKKQEGIDLLTELTNHNLISICSGFTTNCNILNNFQSDIGNKMDKFGILNSRYILKHNDMFSYDDPSGNWKNKFIIGNNLKPIYQSKLLDLYRVPDEYFQPHFYLENTDNKKTSIRSTLEYKKVSNVSYRLNIKNISSSSRLIFNESNNPGWKVYPTTTFQQKPVNDFSYVQFRDNPDQASKETVLVFMSGNKLSTLGDKKIKTKYYGTWNGYQYNVSDSQKFSIDFISNEIHGTIQNNNLSDGHVWDTWMTLPIIDEANHFVANDYANGWNINPVSICNKSPKVCTVNTDGTFDISLIVEFWPQRLYYWGGVISLFSLIVAGIWSLHFIRYSGSIKSKLDEHKN